MGDTIASSSVPSVWISPLSWKISSMNCKRSSFYKPTAAAHIYVRLPEAQKIRGAFLILSSIDNIKN